jgi:hypothetical protein
MSAGDRPWNWDRRPQDSRASAKDVISHLRERASRRLGLGNASRRAAHDRDVRDRQQELTGREETRLRELREQPVNSAEPYRSRGAPDPFAVRKVPARTGRDAR